MFARLGGMPDLETIRGEFPTLSRSRDVFLDNVQTEAAIDEKFTELKGRARRKGIAVGIGHPYPVTMDYLERALPALAAEGIELISVGEAIRYRGGRFNGEIEAP